MQILIVDDEPLARSRLIRLIADLPNCSVCGEAENGDDALVKVRDLDPDLVLLDVRMPGKDGISVAKELEHSDDPPAVVFCTAYDDYALQAFDTLAQGYIVKPVEFSQLAQVIEKTKKLTKVQSQQNAQRAVSAKPTGRRHISAKSRKGIELIAIDSIYCFVADHKYVTVVHSEGESLIDGTLKELEEEFSTLFLRIHRNTLVAIDKIEGLIREGNSPFCLRLKNTDYQPSVSRRHMPNVRAMIDAL